MIDRLRHRFGALPLGSGQSRYVSRRDREAFQRRVLILTVGVVGLLVTSILVIGAFYQYVYLPGQTLAAVNGVEISRGDYWKYRRLELLGQIAQFQQLSQLVTGEQAVQYERLAQQAAAQLRTVESDPVDPMTLDMMVEDQLVLRNMGMLGVEITEADVDDYMVQLFTGVNVGEAPPPLEPDPTAAAWATATAEAMATPAPEGPGATPPAVEGGDPTPDAATPAPDDEAEPTATPDPAAARATATAVLDEYRRGVLDQAGMSVEDFRRLYVRPALARERVRQALLARVPTRAEQVHAAHILVATEEAANVLLNETLPNRDFAEVAREQSADSATAVNGGDLGWFPRGVMVPEFDEVAFSLAPGEISQPVRTDFGWHIIRVIDRDEDRPVSLEMLQTLRARALSDWLAERRAEADIVWNIDAAVPTPPPATRFMPPPDAPPTPTPTPSPTPLPEEEPEPTPAP